MSIAPDESTFYYSDKIQNNVGIKLLCNQKPAYFSDEEWDYIVNKTTKSTEKIISFNATSAYNSDGLLKLLKMQKPLHFPQEKWMELRENLNKSYISLKRIEFPYISYSAEKILLEINTTKPDGLSDEYWSKYIEECEKYLISTVSTDLNFKSDPIKYLKSYEIGISNLHFAL